MKRTMGFVLGAVMLFSCVACAKAPSADTAQPAEPQAQTPVREEGMNKKVLVAYFSHSGNTAAVARQIAAKTGADLYRIETQTPYPDAYGDLLDTAKEEIRSGVKPALKGPLPDLAGYDIVFIGSPNWWGTYAPAVGSFVAQSPLQGKTVALFFTHGGGGMQNCARDLQKQISGATLAQPAAFPGRSGGASPEALDKWLKLLGF